MVMPTNYKSKLLSNSRDAAEDQEAIDKYVNEDPLRRALVNRAIQARKERILALTLVAFIFAFFSVYVASKTHEAIETAQRCAMYAADLYDHDYHPECN